MSLWANLAIVWTFLLFAAVTRSWFFVWAAFGWFLGYAIYLLIT
jgi:hypothetical protein